jgi:hypothetical protein
VTKLLRQRPQMRTCRQWPSSSSANMGSAHRRWASGSVGGRASQDRPSTSGYTDSVAHPARTASKVELQSVVIRGNQRQSELPTCVQSGQQPSH